MPDALETALARVLSEAADAAPEPIADAGRQLLRERDRRTTAHARNRGRLLATAAAFAVLIVLAAGITAIKAFHNDDEVVRPAQKPAKTNYTNNSPLTDVWPDAVVQATAGVVIKKQRYKFSIQRVLPDGRLLVTLISAGNQLPELWAIKPDGSDPTAISAQGQDVLAVAEPAGAQSADRIVYASIAAGGTASTPVYLWYAPAAGGTPARQFTPASIMSLAGAAQSTLRLTDVGDRIVISSPLPVELSSSQGGVRTVTMGGSVRMIPSSAGRTLLQWPWLTDAHEPNNSTIVNALTGQTRRANLPTGGILTCSLDWCLQRVKGTVLVASRAGTYFQILSNDLSIYGIYQNRFVVVGTTKVVDLLTKQALTLPTPASPPGKRRFGPIGARGTGSTVDSNLDSPLGWSITDAANQSWESYLLIDFGKMT